MLRKWNSSESTVLELNLKDAKPTQQLPADLYTKTLGIEWNAAELPPIANITKRALVSKTSNIKVKILLQQLWEQKVALSCIFLRTSTFHDAILKRILKSSQCNSTDLAMPLSVLLPDD